jgi:glycosyltransferase involved in cell wall biosynthesis
MRSDDGARRRSNVYRRMTLRRTLGRMRSTARSLAIALATPDRADVAVFYGHRRLPAPGDPASGGIVKFQRLQERFPNRPQNFNVLYLGSSSLPANEMTLIRLARRRRAAVVVNQNGVPYPGWAGERAEGMAARLTRVLQAADHVIYQSGFCKEAADRFLGPTSGGWEVLHNAVDTTTFVPTIDVPVGGPVLLLAGKRQATYRLTHSLETIRLLKHDYPDVRLIVAGPLDEDEVQLPAKFGVDAHVEYLGQYAQRDAPAVYRQAHLLLHPKVNDPCPNVVIEALACGLPVVHSASGGTPELVGAAGIGIPMNDDWTLGVPPDPEALADAVRNTLCRLDDYRAVARARAVEHFDLVPWLARHQALFEELVGLAG